MKLLIGGKNRNIYMRKDGSAYYKSRGENVDITHMFKKNGGGLKKKYIKGGTTNEKFIDLKDNCNKLNEKLKALHAELNPHTFTASGGSETVTKDFIDSIIKKYYQEDTSLNELADEIKTALTGYASAGGGVQNYKTLMEKLKTVSTEIKSLSTGGDEAIKKTLEEIAVVGAEATFNEKKTELLQKLKSFEEALEEIKQIGETSGETEEANDVEISTSLTVNVLSNFSTDDEDFNRNFFNLAHLVISVINSVNTGGETLTIKSTDNGEIVKLVKKLNALINLFSQSKRSTVRGGNLGVFLEDSSFKSKVIEEETGKFKTQYLQISRTTKEHTYSIQKKDEAITNKICSIFTTFGSICKSNEKPARFVGNPISHPVIAANINAFLNSDEVLVADIKIPP